MTGAVNDTDWAKRSAHWVLHPLSPPQTIIRLINEIRKDGSGCAGPMIRQPPARPHGDKELRTAIQYGGDIIPFRSIDALTAPPRGRGIGVLHTGKAAYAIPHDRFLNELLPNPISLLERREHLILQLREILCLIEQDHRRG